VVDAAGRSPARCIRRRLRRPEPPPEL